MLSNNVSGEEVKENLLYVGPNVVTTQCLPSTGVWGYGFLFDCLFVCLFNSRVFSMNSGVVSTLPSR